MDSHPKTQNADEPPPQSVMPKATRKTTDDNAAKKNPEFALAISIDAEAGHTPDSRHTILTSITVNWTSKRKVLSAERELLFEEFRNSPGDVLIAVRLKALDDKIAECTAFMTAERRRLS